MCYSQLVPYNLKRIRTWVLLGGEVSEEGVWVIADVRRDLMRREEGTCVRCMALLQGIKDGGQKKKAGGWRERRRKRGRE